MVKHYYRCKICGKEGEDRRIRITCSRHCSMVLRNKSGLASKAGLASVSAQKGSRRSKNEIHFYELCDKEFSKVLSNEPMFNGWDADVIIEDFKLAIMWNGNWHYQTIMKGHSLLQVQTRDKIKIKEITKMGYTPYVIEDRGKVNKKLVESEFNKLKDYISSELNFKPLEVQNCDKV